MQYQLFINFYRVAFLLTIKFVLFLLKIKTLNI